MAIIILFFHLGKEDAILLNSKGFTLIEVLIASSLLLLMVSTFVPIFSLLNNERSVLSDRRTISSQLHDELQHYLWDESAATPARFIDTIQHKEVTFRFNTENDFVKGCANWKNVKQSDEVICLYGIPQK